MPEILKDISRPDIRLLFASVGPPNSASEPGRLSSAKMALADGTPRVADTDRHVNMRQRLERDVSELPIAVATVPTPPAIRGHRATAGPCFALRRDRIAEAGLIQARYDHAQEAAAMNEVQIQELLYQALQTEMGGVEVYRTALRCVVNEDLKKEWEEYLTQTEEHVQLVRDVFVALALDPETETPGRAIVQHIAISLVKAMEMALESGPPEAAELVAAECVVHAETKDHLNWDLLGMLAGKAKGEMAQALKEAYEDVEDQEDEHLYHTTGWTRELWIKSLGMPAVLPPPEEEKDVKTAIGAARAKQARGRMKKVS
jgi:rubrerythrin